MSLTGPLEHIVFAGVILANSIIFYPSFKRWYKDISFFRSHPKITHNAFFDIEIDGKEEGRVIFELFGKDAPKTVNNFLGICIAGYDQNLSYWNNKFHKITNDYLAQAGDIIFQDGTGSASVYGTETYEMEKNNLKFKEPYLLATSKRADGTVGSQFFITFDSLPYLNGEYCIFGRVWSNTELIDRINDCGSIDGKPKVDVLIKRSGVYKPKPLLNKSAVDLVDFKPDLADRRK